MVRKQIEYSKDEIIYVLEQYIHDIEDRKIMIVYLTNRPRSLENLAEMCDVSVSTVQRVINRCSFIYKYFPDKTE